MASTLDPMDIDREEPFTGSATEEDELLRSPRPESSQAPMQGEQTSDDAGVVLTAMTKREHNRMQNLAKRLRRKQAKAAANVAALSSQGNAAATAKNIPVIETGVSDPSTPQGKKEMTKGNGARGGNVPKPQGEGAQGKGSNKRLLPSPETGVPKPKKQQNNKPSFAKAVKSDWTVYVRNPAGDLNSDCLANLRKLLCEKIDTIPPEQGKPTFESNFVTDGALKLVCSNEFSRSWLVKTVKEIDNIGGVQITTGKPVFYRLVLTLPDSMGLAKDKIFERLANQNVGLSTEKWKFLQDLKNAKPNWRTIFIGVDQETTTFVKKAKGRLYYMMQTIKADIRRPKGSTKAGEGGK